MYVRMFLFYFAPPIIIITIIINIHFAMFAIITKIHVAIYIYNSAGYYYYYYYYSNSRGDECSFRPSYFSGHIIIIVRMITLACVCVCMWNYFSCLAGRYHSNGKKEYTATCFFCGLKKPPSSYVTN